MVSSLAAIGFCLKRLGLGPSLVPATVGTPFGSLAKATVASAAGEI